MMVTALGTLNLAALALIIAVGSTPLPADGLPMSLERFLAVCDWLAHQ